MIRQNEISDSALRSQIRQRKILWGGNIKMKIYGRLNCPSGKRMKRVNRIFFSAEQEALKAGYRPCGHCMKREYEKWKITFRTIKVFDI
jgi:methylphosphotriester-DNA--protein-cysteine methyltransferase